MGGGTLPGPDIVTFGRLKALSWFYGGGNLPGPDIVSWQIEKGCWEGLGRSRGKEEGWVALPVPDIVRIDILKAFLDSMGGGN